MTAIHAKTIASLESFTARLELALAPYREVTALELDHVTNTWSEVCNSVGHANTVPAVVALARLVRRERNARLNPYFAASPARAA